MRRGAPSEILREELLRTGEQGWTAVPEPDGDPSYRAPAVGLRRFIVGMAFQVTPPAPSGDNTAVPGSPRPGQVVVVTGASAGVGRAVVREFAGQGASIGLLARGAERLEITRTEVERLGGRAVSIPTDVADADAVESAAERIERELGPIDVWVNNAMVTVYSPVAEMSAEEFRRVTDVTFTSPPSFLFARDVKLDVPDVGVIEIDVAWGGNFYAIVDAASVGLDLADPRVGRRILLAESIRDVIDRAQYRPFEGRRRMVIIDDADALVPPAQNALLKTLEEPPSASVFALVSAMPDALLPTVVSRCLTHKQCASARCPEYPSRFPTEYRADHKYPHQCRLRVTPSSLRSGRESLCSLEFS